MPTEQLTSFHVVLRWPCSTGTYLQARFRKALRTPYAKIFLLRQGRSERPLVSSLPPPPTTSITKPPTRIFFHLLPHREGLLHQNPVLRFNLHRETHTFLSSLPHISFSLFQPKSQHHQHHVARWHHLVRDWLQPRHSRPRPRLRIRTVCQLNIRNSHVDASVRPVFLPARESLPRFPIISPSPAAPRPRLRIRPPPVLPLSHSLLPTSRINQRCLPRPSYVFVLVLVLVLALRSPVDASCPRSLGLPPPNPPPVVRAAVACQRSVAHRTQYSFLLLRRRRPTFGLHKNKWTTSCMYLRADVLTRI